MPTQSDLATLIELLRQQLPALTEQYHVRSLGVFGSYVRHAQHSNSDFDVLVTFDQTPSLLQFIELEQHLSAALGVNVDLVMRDALKPGIERAVLNEVVPV